ncbi:MAG: hypothetical protein GTN62_08115 [Gemmatimonadales bacterium]|nr:hypothetical protein [Gemmatimonadales bacterium]NIN11457.1 hypothetical protein [Gemmatimonadales bacterium]NIN50066.1 hypothetical protein [Gemmatimonadales bacterium]NIP07530.1 hypothetical protein [Gemmatimonadales bacterium]NIR03172.1 hypothetical protein [Gemmatimonadales bacterium]
MTGRGTTLVELVVALVLFAIVSVSVYGLLLRGERIYRRQSQRVALSATLRAGVTILSAELQGLSAAGSAGSDIAEMAPAALTYRAPRSLHFACRPPQVTGSSSGTLVVAADPWFGLRAHDPARDSVLVFAEADPTSDSDDYWLRASVSAAPRGGTGCPEGGKSLSIPVTGISPRDALKDVWPGAPVQGFELVRIYAYPDGRGDWWVGARSSAKGGGWRQTQPVFGPIASSGLRFSYYDTNGGVATAPQQVARIGVTVIGRSSEAVRSVAGTTVHHVDSLTTQISLRNVRQLGAERS